MVSVENGVQKRRKGLRNNLVASLTIGFGKGALPLYLHRAAWP